MKTDADNIGGGLTKAEETTLPPKKQLRKKKTDRTICRETLAMTMFQKAMEALEAMDAASLSATNVVHLLEIAAKLEKLSNDPEGTDKAAASAGSVQIYLPDNSRDGQEMKK